MHTTNVIKLFSCTGYPRALMSTQTGEKPFHYQCSRCDKYSSKKESWTHTEEKMY